MTEHANDCPEKLPTLMWLNPSHSGPYHHFCFFPFLIFDDSSSCSHISRPLHTSYTLTHFTIYNKIMMSHHSTQSLPKPWKKERNHYLQLIQTYIKIPMTTPCHPQNMTTIHLKHITNEKENRMSMSE